MDSPLALALVVFGAMGCTHTVQLSSNVPEATVRVDGAQLGKVKDGAVFQEPWGSGHVYDIEGTAPRHRVARLKVRPNVVDGLGALAMVSAVGGGALTAVSIPFVAGDLYAYAVPPPGHATASILLPLHSDGTVDRDAAGLSLSYWAGLLALYGCTGTSWWAVAGSERLPDEIHLELEPEVGLGDEGLPPPPSPAAP